MNLNNVEAKLTRNSTAIDKSKGTAYYWLGQVAHLLDDFTLPAHALNDGHFPTEGDTDPLHDWIDNVVFSKTGEHIIGDKDTKFAKSVAAFDDDSFVASSPRYERWKLHSDGVGRVANAFTEQGAPVPPSLDNGPIRSPLQVFRDISREIVVTPSQINISTNKITKVGHGIEGDNIAGKDQVVATQVSASQMPGGLNSSTIYFVRKVSADEFTLHATAADAANGMNPVDINSQGSGDIRFILDPELRASFPNIEALDFDSINNVVNGTGSVSNAFIKDNMNVFLYALFLDTAAVGDNFDGRESDGQLDQGNRSDPIRDDPEINPDTDCNQDNYCNTYNNWELNELYEVADVIVPKAIRSTAELLRFFYAMVDTQDPSVSFKTGSVALQQNQLQLGRRFRFLRKLRIKT